jgi:hypothetical protein
MKSSWVVQQQQQQQQQGNKETAENRDIIMQY